MCACTAAAAELEGPPWSYSVSKVGATDDDFNAMVEPHGSAGTVFFAGEHTCAAFQGYVHGGILSGRRAAAEVMLALGKEEAAGKAYDWSCETLRANHTAKAATTAPSPATAVFLRRTDVMAALVLPASLIALLAK